MDIKLFESILLKNNISEYLQFVQNFKIMDTIQFSKKYKKIIESQFEVDDFLEYCSEDKIDRKELLLLFSLWKKIIFEIDWSGEEYSGQVKKSVNQLLKNCGITNFKWKHQSILKEITKLEIKRGEYLPWLFKNINEELEPIQYQVKFIDMENDAYYYFVISNENYDNVKHIKNLFNDMNTYEMYLLTKTMNTKIMIYIKNKFNLKLDEVKEFIKQEKILILTGTDKQIKYEQKMIDNYGGEIVIECKEKI